MGQPLDKEKAFLYGRFVQAAYTMFRDPQGGDPLRPEPAGIPEGYELGAWIHMSDFILNLKEPEFYGIVCRKIDNPDWRIVAIRGTEGAIEWIDDAAALPRPFRQVPDTGRVASGFDKIYSSLKVVKRRLAEDRAVAAAAPGQPRLTPTTALLPSSSISWPAAASWRGASDDPWLKRARHGLWWLPATA